MTLGEGLRLMNIPNWPLVFIGSLHERRPGAVKLGEALDRRDLCVTGEIWEKERVQVYNSRWLHTSIEIPRSNHDGTNSNNKYRYDKME